jgi:hypothetical protein
MPNVPEEEVEGFACAMGRAIHHYGIIEHSINELLSVLIDDKSSIRSLLQLGVAKRLELLESLIAKKEALLRTRGWQIGDLISVTKAAFRERNKIAHNPFYVRVDRETGEADMGILVVRYHQDPDDEEWVNRSKLDKLVAESRVIFNRFGQLRELCQAAA